MEQEQLDAMSTEELQTLVDQEGATEQVQTEQEAPEQVEQATSEPPKDEIPAWYRKEQENLKRELGSLRSLQSLGDKLPKLIEEKLSAALSKLQQNPQDTEAQAQLQAQQDQLAKYVREQARAEFGEAGKEYIKLLDELKEQKQDFSHRQSSLELVKDVIPEEADKAWNDVFEQSYKDIEAGKPGALERQERLEKDPAFVALAMIQAQRNKVSSQAQQVTDAKRATAKQAAQTIKPGVPKAGVKSVAEMSEAELDSMSVADLEAAIPEQG